MKKVLVTDGVHPILIKGLESDGYHCDYQPDISLEEVHKIIGHYDGIIINSKIIVDKTLLDKAKKLRFVGRLGSGLEIIDLVYARQKEVDILNSPEGNRNAVAEQALGMLLALANNLLRADREVRNRIWEREKNRGFEIMGKTVGIIGFGHTGSSFARKLQGMGVRILAYDKYKTDYTEGYPYVDACDQQTICREADIISFHLPLSKETTHLANADFLIRCKSGVILINTSRGSVVDTAALIKALKSGQVGGACLDVFENEKTATFTAAENKLYDQLYQIPNVILSPHIAGWTVQSKERLAKILLFKIRESQANDRQATKAP